LEGPNGLLIEQALRFAFKASNNQAEYEALIAAILLPKEMGPQSLLAKSDSLLVTGQVTEEYQAKDPHIAAYLKTPRTFTADNLVGVHQVNTVKRREEESSVTVSRDTENT